ncbi:MAG: hypothetical protein ACM30H_08055 [Clostridia bacterium]
MEWFLIGWVFLMAVVLTSIASLPASEPKDAPGPAPAPAEPHFDLPERVTDPIGRYMDKPIYRSVFLAGQEYFFDRIAPQPELAFVSSRERLVSPGIIYRLH